MLVALPAPGDGPHLGYAVQWFIFTAIAVIGYPLVLRHVSRRPDRAALVDDEEILEEDASRDLVRSCGRHAPSARASSLLCPGRNPEPAAAARSSFRRLLGNARRQTRHPGRATRPASPGSASRRSTRGRRTGCPAGSGESLGCPGTAAGGRPSPEVSGISGAQMFAFGQNISIIRSMKSGTSTTRRGDRRSRCRGSSVPEVGGPAPNELQRQAPAAQAAGWVDPRTRTVAESEACGELGQRGLVGLRWATAAT